mgnify:CR=1 FL=1
MNSNQASLTPALFCLCYRLTYVNCKKSSLCTFELIWEEWVEHGPREAVAQQRGMPFVPIQAGPQSAYTIEPNGTLWNLSPVVELQKAEARLIRFAGDPRVDQRVLYEEYFRRDDVRLAQRVLLPEEQVQQNLQRAAQAQAQTGKNGQKPGGPQQSLLQTANSGVGR